MLFSRQLVFQLALLCLFNDIYKVSSFKALPQKLVKVSSLPHIVVSTSKDSIELIPNNIENKNAIEFQKNNNKQDDNNNTNINNKSQLWKSLPFLALLVFAASPAFANEYSTLALSSATLNMELVSKYFLAGGVSCSISHGLGVPFDVVKTRKQVSKDMNGLSIVESFKKIIGDDGILMLFKGKFYLSIYYSIIHYSIKIVVSINAHPPFL